MLQVPKLCCRSLSKAATAAAGFVNSTLPLQRKPLGADKGACRTRFALLAAGLVGLPLESVVTVTDSTLPNDERCERIALRRVGTVQSVGPIANRRKSARS